MTAGSNTEALRSAGLAVIVLGVVIAGLVYGRSFLVPLVVAIFLWNLLEAMIQGFARVELGSFKLPRSLATLLGFAAVTLGFLSRPLRSPGTGRCRGRRLAPLCRPLRDDRQ